MEFEFDPAKSLANQKKHGIDFLSAQELWSDVDRVEASAQSLTEPRFQILGQIEGKLWSAFITYRGERIRIISVRRAREDEKARYHDH